MSESLIPPRYRSLSAVVVLAVAGATIDIGWMDFALLFVGVVLLSYDMYHSGYEDAKEELAG